MTFIINEMSGGMYGGTGGYMNPPTGYGMDSGGMQQPSSTHHRPESGPFFDYQPTNFEPGRYHEQAPVPQQSQAPAYDKFYGKGWG
jgi:hypothetical protein